MIKYLILIIGLLINNPSELTKATDFEFTLDDGSVKNLSDYKGEVVYLSFWASWCGPCISNYKKYHKLRTELEEMGVVLLNVSIDIDNAKWRKSLKSNVNINGVNGHANDIEFVRGKYNLYSIPLYEILNRKGDLVYLTQTYPRDILADFKSWLNE